MMSAFILGSWIVGFLGGCALWGISRLHNKEVLCRRIDNAKKLMEDAINSDSSESVHLMNNYDMLLEIEMELI
jgi:hypothetical protein